MNKLPIILLASVILSGFTLNAQEGKQPPPQKAAQPAEAAKPPARKLPSNAQFKKLLDELTPRSVVVEIDGQTATWRELYPHIQKYVEDLQTGRRRGRQTAVELIQATLQQLVARRMFAMEAQRLGFLPGEDEIKVLEAEIADNLKASKDKKIRTLAQYKASLDMTDPNLLNVSYEDILNIMYLNKKLFADITITDKELDFYIRYKKAVQRGISGINIQRLEAMKTLAKNPKLQTEAGFKELAKEYSEGVESDWGGEIDYDFTREDLAEVNEIKEFSWKVGEVTPVLETASAFRIMRILRAIPPKTPGEPEKYRVAQILGGKVGDFEDLNDREGIRSRLTPEKQKAKIEEYTYQLSQQFNVKTPLFPDGLWQKPQPPQLPVPPAPKKAPLEQEGPKQESLPK